MKWVCLVVLSVSGYLLKAQGFDYTRDFIQILESTKDKSSSLSFHNLLNRFYSNDSTLTRQETLALLIGYTDNEFYDPYNDMEKEKEIFALNEAGYYDDALEESKKYLLKHPVSLKILKEISFCYNQTGKPDSAQYYMQLVDKLMSAMIYSGKGRTPENPIFSLALDDGEQFVPNIGMTIVKKATGTNKNKQFIEIVTARTDEGVIINFFFVIEHAKQKMEGKDISEKAPKKNRKEKKKESKTSGTESQ